MKPVLLLCLLLSFSVPVLASTSVTALLVDISGSVPAEDFQKAQEFIQQILKSAGPDDKVDLYAFGNDLHKVNPDELKNLQASETNTMLFDAAYDAARELQKEKADRKSIIIISDGIDTKSATILEDTATYVNQNGIAVYGVGVGKYQRKSLERLSRLTGGKFFSINTPDIANALNAARADQKLTELPASRPVVTPASVQGDSQPSPQPQQPASSPAPIEPSTPEPRASSYTFLWVGGIGGGVLFLFVVSWIVARAFKKEERTCPTCGRILESYQTVCPSCPAYSPDSTQELNEAGNGSELIPAELLEKRSPATEEMLSKTFVLMQTPILVIRKGPNVGKAFSLNRIYPVSIGRSRVNEIKVEDSTVSGQHCRIIPENGRHVLYDMESTNGTFVNEKRVNKLILSEGDIIKVGETQFLYKVEQQRN